MGKFSTIKKLMHGNKRQLLVALYNNIVHTGITNILPDKIYLKLTYRIRFGKKLNLNNPVEFNEKLQWLKLYDRQERYVELVDKVLVKEYVAKAIGKQYVIPTLGVWDRVEDIDFENLPNQFVLKCNHDSGSVVICRDKKTFNVEKAKKKLAKGLRTDAFFWGREWPYKNVKRKIFAETYLQDEDKEELTDYKLMCFNGTVKCSFVCSERFSEDGLKVTFFDQEWNVLPFERHYPKSRIKIKKPSHYDDMVRIAEILSKNIPFVRVDFYEVKGKVYFGETTFFPGSGWEEFEPSEWDRVLGNWIMLDKSNE